MRATRALVVLLSMALVAGACGARLTQAQVAALNATNSNSGSSSSSGSSSVAGAATTTTVAGAAASSSGNAASASSAGSSGSAGPGASGAIPGLAVASSVCAGPASGTGITASEVDVGTVTTETGPIPGLNQGTIYGIQAFVAYMNAQGGICGRKLVDKLADDNLNASQNATATQSLVNSVFAMVASNSGDDEGGASSLQSSGIPDVGEALSAQRFNLANNFSPVPIPAGLNLAPYLTFKQRYPNAVTHMAILAENQSTALADTQAEQQALESIGYKFVYTDFNIEPTQSDFSADAQAMKSAGAQGLFFLAIGPLYADVAKAIQNAGLNMQFPDYSENAYDPAFLADAGSAANGSILASYLSMYQGEDAGTVPVIGTFNKWYRAVSGGQTPDEFAAWSWMAGMLFVDGLNAGGGLTRANLLAGLKKVTSFDSGGFQSPANPAAKTPPYCYLIIDIVNQKFVRDSTDPATGMNCANAPNYYVAK